MKIEDYIPQIVKTHELTIIKDKQKQIFKYFKSVNSLINLLHSNKSNIITNIFSYWSIIVAKNCKITYKLKLNSCLNRREAKLFPPEQPSATYFDHF